MHKKPRIPPLFADPRIEKLRPFDKNAAELVFGDWEVGLSTGYKSPTYATEKIYKDATSRQRLDVAGTVFSEQNRIAHWYFVGRDLVTHPDSAAAAGKTARAETKQNLRDATRGWQRASWELDVRAPSKKKSPRKK